METRTKDSYYKGYVAGYRDGVRDGANGRNLETLDSDIANYPIEVMALSSRAQNCLSKAGCTYIHDVVTLSEYTIETMRNLGTKTASEIAQWLDDHGICYSAWSKYL